MLPAREQTETPVQRHEVIAVSSDWTDPRGLIGYENPLTGTYATTDLIRLLLRAEAIREQPYVVILDEMNLARVEYYFSDFLSAMELERRARSRFASRRDGASQTRTTTGRPGAAAAAAERPLHRHRQHRRDDARVQSQGARPRERARLQRGRRPGSSKEAGSPLRSTFRLADGVSIRRASRNVDAANRGAVTARRASPASPKRSSTFTNFSSEHNLHFGYRVLREITTFVGHALERVEVRTRTPSCRTHSISSSSRRCCRSSAAVASSRHRSPSCWRSASTAQPGRASSQSDPRGSSSGLSVGHRRASRSTADAEPEPFAAAGGRLRVAERKTGEAGAARTSRSRPSPRLSASSTGSRAHADPTPADRLRRLPRVSSERAPDGAAAVATDPPRRGRTAAQNTKTAASSSGRERVSRRPPRQTPKNRRWQALELLAPGLGAPPLRQLHRQSSLGGRRLHRHEQPARAAELDDDARRRRRRPALAAFLLRDADELAYARDVLSHRRRRLPGLCVSRATPYVASARTISRARSTASSRARTAAYRRELADVPLAQRRPGRRRNPRGPRERSQPAPPCPSASPLAGSPIGSRPR